jgi:hemerythrin-like domain-containing protein
VTASVEIGAEFAVDPRSIDHLPPPGLLDLGQIHSRIPGGQEMPDTGSPYADTRGMVIVHDMFRREFALLPALIETVPAAEAERRRTVADHVRLLCGVLHHHHSAEDAVLWPLLLSRAPREIDPVVHLAEGHHQAIAGLLTEVGELLDAWTDGAAYGREAFALAPLTLALRRLAVAAHEHMALEERLVLPLAGRYIFASEWEQMTQQSAAGIDPENLIVVVGMVMYEHGAELLPPMIPTAMIEAAPKEYAAYCERVHGTATPPRSAEVTIGTPFVGVAGEAARVAEMVP